MNIARPSPPSSHTRPLLTHYPLTLRPNMLDVLDITEEEALGLAELAQLDLAMARDFARRAQAAHDNDEANRLARSYQRAARSYRQTLAVKARLKRDLAAAARVQAETPRARPGGLAVAQRLALLRTALLRVAWDEAERPEIEPPGIEPPGIEPDETRPDADTHAEDLAWFVEARDNIRRAVAMASTHPDFAHEPIDDQAARLAMDVGLDACEVARWRDLPDPPQAVLDLEPEEAGPGGAVPWRSSA